MGFEIEEVDSGKKILVATIQNWTRERSEELRDVNKALDKLEAEERKAAQNA